MPGDLCVSPCVAAVPRHVFSYLLSRLQDPLRYLHLQWLPRPLVPLILLALLLIRNDAGEYLDIRGLAADSKRVGTGWLLGSHPEWLIGQGYRLLHLLLVSKLLLNEVEVI